MIYAILRLLMRSAVAIVLGRHMEVRGQRNIPKHGAVLMCSNHIASVDPPLTGAMVPRFDVFYMAKSEYFRLPHQAALFRAYHAFPVERYSADRNALRHALDILKRQHVLVIYPEGTRSLDGHMQRVFPGAGFLARKSRATIVPTAIWGSENVLPKGASWFRRSRVHLVFGKPFTVDSLGPRSAEMTNQEVADAIMAKVAELLPERYRAQTTLLTKAAGR